jgi:hypothetical protein
MYDSPAKILYDAAQATTAPSPPSPPSQTLQILASLRESQNETHDIISRLEARLADVLLPEPPSAEGKNGVQPGAIQSPLCEELERRCGVEYSARTRLSRLIERLTV